jgi:hypothetical protein
MFPIQAPIQIFLPSEDVLAAACIDWLVRQGYTVTGPDGPDDEAEAVAEAVESGTAAPVRHWVEVLDEALAGAPGPATAPQG